MSNAAVIAALPQGVSRVKVRDLSGKGRYKSPEDVTEDDVIETRQDGQPIVQMDRSGRPTTATVPAADSEESLMQANQRQARAEEHLRRDPILRGLRKDPDDGEIFVEVLSAMGREVALLEHQRNSVVESRGGHYTKDTVDMTIKRISGLRMLFEALARRRDQQAIADLDPDSPGVQQIIAAVLEVARDSMLEGGIRPEIVETTFTRAAGTIGSTNWENELRIRIRTAMAPSRS